MGSTTNGGGNNGYDPGCEYMFNDEQSCRSHAAVNAGCYWGNKQETCYAPSSSQCSALGGGCRWTTYPDQIRSCTSASWESECNGNGAGVCTWGPRE